MISARAARPRVGANGMNSLASRAQPRPRGGAGNADGVGVEPLSEYAGTARKAKASPGVGGLRGFRPEVVLVEVSGLPETSILFSTMSTADGERAAFPIPFSIQVGIFLKTRMWRWPASIRWRTT